MSRLFAEQFLTPPIASGAREPELRYDEERQLNVLADGRPFVALAHGGGDTFTEVRTEADDYDERADEGAPSLDTVTKVLGERDDFAADALSLATETRMQPGERDDFDRDRLLLGTYTAGDGEPDDDDIQARAFEDADFAVLTATKTSVPREADDFCGDEERVPVVAPAQLRR